MPLHRAVLTKRLLGDALPWESASLGHGIDLLALIVNTVRKIGWLDVVSCRRAERHYYTLLQLSRGD